MKKTLVAAALAAGGLLPAGDAAALRDGYSFLRFVEARLRVVTDRALTAIPEGADDQAKLAHRLGFGSPAEFLAALRRATAGVRAAYLAILARERG